MQDLYKGIIKKVIKRRMYNLRKRCNFLSIEGPPKELEEELLKRLFLMHETNKMICEYCERPITTNATIQTKDQALSLDHKIPLTIRTNHSPSNIAICCARCNLAKGTIHYTTFKQVIYILKQHDPVLLDTYLNEMYRGSLVNKIIRVEKEKEGN